MKAFTFNKNGGIENLILREIPKPSIQPHEVLIKTQAISINRIDAFVRQHDFAIPAFIKPRGDEKYFVLGWDVSGTIVATGSAVTDFKKGDEVFGLVNFFGHGQTYAEYVAAPAHHLALKPATISHEEAAAACLAALAAWQALVTYGTIQLGDRVIIHGASGGVGHYAVQLAKHFGAYVIGINSAANKAFIEMLGADEFINYETEKFEEKIKNADLVLDSHPGEHILRSMEAVRHQGKVIGLLPYDDKEGKMVEKIKAKELFYHRLQASSNGADMNQLAALLGSRAIRSYVSDIFRFEELPKTHLLIESGKTNGKMVVTFR